MKILIAFIFIILAAIAFLSVEAQPVDLPELRQELKSDQKNTLASVDVNPSGDQTESDAERAKRFIFCALGK